MKVNDFEREMALAIASLNVDWKIYGKEIKFTWSNGKRHGRDKLVYNRDVSHSIVEAFNRIACENGFDRVDTLEGTGELYVTVNKEFTSGVSIDDVREAVESCTTELQEEIVSAFSRYSEALEVIREYEENKDDDCDETSYFYTLINTLKGEK